MSDQEFRPNETLARLYPEAAVGGYTQLDGQVEFYTRVNALVGPESQVLDFGAGRGQWAVDPMPEMARRLRMLRGRVARVVGTDVDDAVLTNPALDEARAAAPPPPPRGGGGGRPPPPPPPPPRPTGPPPPWGPPPPCSSTSTRS